MKRAIPGSRPAGACAQLAVRTCEPVSDLRDSVLELIAVSGVVEAALRFGDEPVRAHFPDFESADTNSLSCSAGAGIGAGQGPVIDGVIAFDESVIHRHRQVRERSHEALCD